LQLLANLSRKWAKRFYFSLPHDSIKARMLEARVLTMIPVVLALNAKK
jgi:hypothetical protein